MSKRWWPAVIAAVVAMMAVWVVLAVPAPPDEVAPKQPRPTREPTAAPLVDLTVASFNVLGSSHTRPRGNRSAMDPAEVRMRGVLDLLGREDVDLVGFQEMLRDQQRTFAATAPGWRLWPGETGPGRAGEASVAWRTDTWRLVDGDLGNVPDADGAPRPFPTVLLEHRESGMLLRLSNYHHPADTRRYPRQERFRQAARREQVELVDRTEAAGIPQLVTGDMNDREDYFCAVTGATTLTTGAGGSHEGGTCVPPAAMVVDWVLGSDAFTWTAYDVVRDALVRRTTDHAMVVASARVDPADFPQARASGQP